METSKKRTLNARFTNAIKPFKDWESIVPLKGEITIGIPDDWDGQTPTEFIIKVGDGVNSWEKLKDASGKPDVVVLQKEDLTQDDIEFIESEITEPEEGIFVIVETAITNSEDDTKSTTLRTCYIYNNSIYQALNGNYNADHVYFDDDIALFGNYETVGNINIKDGVINSKGMSVSKLFEEIFTKELMPDVVSPSIRIRATNSGEYEVGTTITPTYEISTNAGKYSYGPETGVVFDAEPVVSVLKNNAETDGNLMFVVTDNDVFKLKVASGYSQGVQAKTNMGNLTDTRIEAGTATNISSQNYTGFRKMFYKCIGVYDDDTLTSDNIRSFISQRVGNQLAISAVGLDEHSKEFIKLYVAIPNTYKIESVIMPSSLNADVTTNFEKQENTVHVAGAEGNNLMEYKIYKYEPDIFSELSSFEIYLVKDEEV